MKIKPIKPILSVLLCFLLLGTIKVLADAYSLQEVEVLPSDSVVEISDAALESFILSDASSRATNSFKWSISPYVTKQADTHFSLSANETVTFNCTSTPSSASVDFGLISSDGTFYHANSSNGRIKGTVKVPKTDKYFLAFRNNSSMTIQVTGTVSY